MSLRRWKGDYYIAEGRDDQVKALERMAREEIERCAAVLRHCMSAYAVEPHTVRVLCDLRGRSRAGIAYPHLSTIRLSPSYAVALGEAYRATIAHEYAHLAVRRGEEVQGLQRSRPHGTRWQIVMRVLGHTPDRSVTSDEAAKCEAVPWARRASKYLYRCAAGHEHKVGVQRHRNMRRGSNYLCCARECRALPIPQRRLSFVEEVS